MNQRLGSCAALAAAVAAVVLPGIAQASGFGLLEQSARSLGRAHSGGAALVDDASAIFYNPAGLTELRSPQFSGNLSYINLQASFHKDIAVDAAGRPLSGPENGGSEKPGYVPALYFGAPANDRLSWGFGVYAPFGLSTDYPSDSIARYQAIYSGLEIVNATPAVAYKFDDTWSFGLGVDVQHLAVKLTNDVDYGAVCFGALDPVTCQGLGLAPQSHDGYAAIEGTDTAVGWHAGVLGHFGATRVGFVYRSSITHDIDGNATFKSVPAVFANQGLFQDGGAKARLKTPQMVSISVAQDLDPRWTISGDATWTNWSTFEELHVKFDNPRQPDTVQPENWHNAWRYSVGVDYRYNDAWTLRGGLAFDESAVRNEFRTARLPGRNRRWVAFGASWHVAGNFDLDMGYAHLFVGHTGLNQTGASGDHLAGTYNVATDIVSAGVRYNF